FVCEDGLSSLATAGALLQRLSRSMIRVDHQPVIVEVGMNLTAEGQEDLSKRASTRIVAIVPAREDALWAIVPPFRAKRSGGLSGRLSGIRSTVCRLPILGMNQTSAVTREPAMSVIQSRSAACAGLVISLLFVRASWAVDLFVDNRIGDDINDGRS